MPFSGVQTCALDRKSTRLNSSHGSISYAVFCLKKQQNPRQPGRTPSHAIHLHLRGIRTRHARPRMRYCPRWWGAPQQVFGLSFFFFFLKPPPPPPFPPLSPPPPLFR